MGEPRPAVVIGNWRGARELILFLQGSVFFSDDEAEAFSEACRQLLQRADWQLDRVGCLVITDGGGPTASQRSRFRAFLDGRSLRTAVVSSSRLTRGIVAAINWFNPEIRSFAPGDLARAFRHLDVRVDDLPALWAEIDRLDASIHLAILDDVRRQGVPRTGGIDQSAK